MKFTPSIKTLLKKEMETNKGNCIAINFASSCCGRYININSTKEEDDTKIKLFDEIPVVISNEDEKMLQEVTFDYENEEITIKSACTCGNC